MLQRERKRDPSLSSFSNPLSPFSFLFLFSLSSFSFSFPFLLTHSLSSFSCATLLKERVYRWAIWYVGNIKTIMEMMITSWTYMTIDQRERRRRVGFADSADGCGQGGGWGGRRYFGIIVFVCFNLSLISAHLYVYIEWRSLIASSILPVCPSCLSCKSPI